MRVALRLAVVLLLPAGAAQAAPLVLSPFAQCEAAIRTAQLGTRLPSGLLGAVAAVESGRPDPRTGATRPWPWTIDAEGQGAFFATKAQAIAAVRALQEAGVRSIDVGCLQVNLLHHPHAFRSLEQAFDPRANARYAAFFLDRLHRRTGDWRRAVGAYHSETPTVAADYRMHVLALWRAEGLPRPVGGFAPRSQVYADFLPRGRVYADFSRR